MGVLQCNRRKCDNVMCDRHSYTYGYICSDCFLELISFGPEASIEFFMDSVRVPNKENQAFARFDAEFSIRD